MSTDLSRLASDVTSLYWWISIICVGFGLNILGAYAKPWLDKWYESRSTKKREMTAAYAAQFWETVGKVSADPLLIIMMALQEVKLLLFFALELGIIFGLFGVLHTVTSKQEFNWVTGIEVGVLFGLITFLALTALYMLNRAQQTSRVVNAAKKKLLADRGL